MLENIFEIIQETLPNEIEDILEKEFDKEKLEMIVQNLIINIIDNLE